MTMPNAGHAGSSAAAPPSSSFTIANRPVAVPIHAVLGLALIVIALATAVRAGVIRHGGIIALAVVGLAALTSAATDGTRVRRHRPERGVHGHGAGVGGGHSVLPVHHVHRPPPGPTVDAAQPQWNRGGPTALPVEYRLHQGEIVPIRSRPPSPKRARVSDASGEVSGSRPSRSLAPYH